ncbi:Protein OPY2 [Stagonosporopsis vannaccii]|nr:Protein OPY2 [Stagonosporopsis vannaccii]
MKLDARRELEHVLFKRCVECDSSGKNLSCDGMNCSGGKVCILTPQSCEACASVSCMIDPTERQNAPSKPNVGAIAGGVIGGIVVIAVIVFVIWKYCLKGKRRPISEMEWQEEEEMEQQEKADNDFASRRSARASTHTVASMASSVLTRASNIIQIAYIPGVTNRSGPGSPDLLVPPVPPVPAMSPSSAMSSPYSNADRHFFVPDFRDSMASDSTRQSIAPSLARNSVASTMYRQNAIVSPLPAQTIVRGKAAVVSVKSNGSNTPEDAQSMMSTPPVPQIDPKHAQQVKPIRIQMPGLSSKSSVQSTATLGPVRALNITKKKSSDTTPPKSLASSFTSGDRTAVATPEALVPPARPLTNYSVASTDSGASHARARQAVSLADSDSESDEDEDHQRSRQSLLRNSLSSRDSGVTEIQDATPTGLVDLRSPFSDSSAVDRTDRPAIGSRITSYDTDRSRMPMTPIVEESERRASAMSKRDQSPFADDYRSDLK